MTCFQGHNLGLCLKVSLPWYCDMCGSESMNSVSLHNCSVCNFDSCNACAGYERCTKGHPLLQSECNSDETCSVCNKCIVHECLVCNQCEYILCKTCAVMFMINRMTVNLPGTEKHKA